MVLPFTELSFRNNPDMVSYDFVRSRGGHRTDLAAQATRSEARASGGPETAAQAPKSAWGDEVGPHAATDTPPEPWFPARRRRVAATRGPADIRRSDKVGRYRLMCLGTEGPMADNLVWPSPGDLGLSRIVRPVAAGPGLPVLYLLHGIGDAPSDWWSAKGQLSGILAGVGAHPMLLVAIANGTPDHTEPPLAQVAERLNAARIAVNERFQPDPQRQGIVGISMGAKQALSLLLNQPAKGGFSVLALFSGMFQGHHLQAVHGDLKSWPANVGASLQLYFHYCGQGASVPNGVAAPAGHVGDATFLESNRQVCAQLGGELRVRADGMHNWFFWRPALADFFRTLNTIW